MPGAHHRPQGGYGRLGVVGLYAKQDQVHGTNSLRGVRDFSCDSKLAPVMYNPKAAALNGSQVVASGNEGHVVACIG